MSVIAGALATGAGSEAQALMFRNWTEGAWRESEQQLGALANAVPSIIWSANESGEITWISDRWFKYTGLKATQPTREWPSDVLHPEDHSRWEQKWKACLADGADYDIEIRCRRHDGEYRWFLSRAVPVRDETTRVVAWFGSTTDIHDRKLAEEALSRVKEELARSNEQLEKRVYERTASLREAVAQLEEFSYTVSHDLRAPVRAMHGYAELLLHHCSDKLDSESRMFLNRIIQSGAHMDRLIQNVLAYSRLSRCETKLEPVSLEHLVPEIIHNYPQMQPPHAEIKIGRLLGVIGHESSLAQVISNLLSNAVKFIAPGTRPHVQIRTVRRGRNVRLFVKDNGIGINPKYHRRIFGMFERIHTKGHYEGTGIGLAIVKKYVERMGGLVGFDSDGVSGSTFWIELPAA